MLCEFQSPGLFAWSLCFDREESVVALDTGFLDDREAHSYQRLLPAKAYMEPVSRQLLATPQMGRSGEEF
jgi:hypothetical protein